MFLSKFRNFSENLRIQTPVRTLEDLHEILRGFKKTMLINKPEFDEKLSCSMWAQKLFEKLSYTDMRKKIKKLTSHLKGLQRDYVEKNFPIFLLAHKLSENPRIQKYVKNLKNCTRS